MASLQRLSLYTHDSTDAKALAALPNLQVLHLPYYNGSCAPFAPLPLCDYMARSARVADVARLAASLTSLQITGHLVTDLGDRDTWHTMLDRPLERLHLGMTLLADAILGELGLRCTRLTHLGGQFQATAVPVEFKGAAFPRLQSLALAHTVSPTVIAWFQSHVPDLRELSLRSAAGVTVNRSMDRLSAFSKLASLELHGDRCTDAELLSLVGAFRHTLRSLKIYRVVDVPDAELAKIKQTLAQFTRLTHLTSPVIPGPMPALESLCTILDRRLSAEDVVSRFPSIASVHLLPHGYAEIACPPPVVSWVSECRRLDVLGPSPPLAHARPANSHRVA